MASNSSFRRILHNSFSFTGPYIFRKIFLSNTANAQLKDWNPGLLKGPKLLLPAIVHTSGIASEIQEKLFVKSYL
jgi:hypothetical protein